MRIELPSGTPAELARPDAGEPVRGLVIAPDIGGLRPLFDDLCARLAAEHRWVVCAPEPFPGREQLTLEDRLAAVRDLDDGRQVGDLLEAADAIGTQPVAVLGFCMGGMYALKAAGSGRFDRVVSFYGMIRIPDQWRGPGHEEPLDAVRRGDPSSVLALVGGQDPWTPASDVDDLEGAGAAVVRYSEAEHGFVHDPERPAHRAADAADAWSRAVAFLSHPGG